MSSSAPGASPTNIRSAFGLPTPKTTCLRPSVWSLQRRQSDRSRRAAPRALLPAMRRLWRVERRSDGFNEGFSSSVSTGSAAHRVPSARRGLRDSAFGTRAPLRLEADAIDTELAEELEMGTQIVVHCDQRIAGRRRASPQQAARRDRGSRAATRSLLCSEIDSSPSWLTIVTALVSTSKPARAATRRWRRSDRRSCASRFSRAFAQQSPVSAANPTSTGRVASACRRRAEIGRGCPACARASASAGRRPWRLSAAPRDAGV